MVSAKQLQDYDSDQSLGINNRAVRRKILRHVRAVLEREKQLPVILQDELSHSKKEFLQVTGPKIAADSLSVYHQILFTEWLGRSISVAMFRNSWSNLCPSLKVILGNKPAVSFEQQLFQTALDILTYQLSPRSRVTGVILEQAYLNSAAEIVKPLRILATSSPASVFWPFDSDEVHPKVFISYQWDVQSKVKKIRNYLEANGLPCWADLTVQGQRFPRTHSSIVFDRAAETLQSQIWRNMKAAHAVVSCLTPRYIQSDNYCKDVQLAITLKKPLVPVLLHFLRWPLNGMPINIRKFLFHFPVLNLSNDKLFNRNLHLILKRLEQYVGR